MYIEINSKDNNNLKLLKKLSSPKGRKEHKMFFAEGKRFLQYKPEFIFCLRGKEVRMPDITTFILNENLFKSVSTLENSEGYISVFKIKDHGLENLSNNIVLLDEVQNPNNLGAIARNMNAFGIGDMVLTKGSCDPFSPKSVRSSMGSIMDIRVFYLEKPKYEEILGKYNLIVTDCNEGVPLNDISLCNNNCVVFGNESRGISNDILSFANQKINIPLVKEVDSLNVAVTSGIVIYSLFSNR